MFRKRRQPTPNFRMPPPFQPISGHHASLQAPGLWPYCALMQVAENDIYDNYCLCRGFDTRMNKFVDYEAGNAEKPGIPVAKPYGCRTTGTYEIAHVHLALLPIQSSDSAGDTSSSVYRVPPSPITAPIRLGQNPGKATSGQPASLSEDVTLLYTTDGKAINWMFLDCPSTPSVAIYFGKLVSSLAHNTAGDMTIWCDGSSTGVDLEVMNRTTQTLLTGILMKATRAVGCTEYLVEPYELDPCP